MNESELTFCASYEDGKAPAERYNEHMKPNQAKKHDSKRL